MQLTQAQKTTLKNAIAANTNTIDFGGPTPINGLPNTLDAATEIANQWYNKPASPAFTVWKGRTALVQLTEVGDAMDSSELAGLTTANTSRLQAIAQYSANGICAAIASRRAAFDDIFSGAGGANTRAALLALWKRTALRIEALFATGTGSDASPATMVAGATGWIEGTITGAQILDARTNG